MYDNSTRKTLRQKVQVHSDGSSEYWRDIPEYIGYYRVSDWGRVKSCARFHWQGSKYGVPMKCQVQEKILKQKKEKAGYLSVTLRKDGEVKYFLVHRLVLIAFVGACPKGMEARHFPDNTKSNNRTSNLSWATKKVNQADRIIHGTSNFGQPSNNKLTQEEARKVRQLYSTGRYTQDELADIFKKVSSYTIGAIVRGDRITYK